MPCARGVQGRSRSFDGYGRLCTRDRGVTANLGISPFASTACAAAARERLRG